MSNIQKYNSLNSDLFSWVDRIHDSFWSEPAFQLNRNWRPTEFNETEKEYNIEIELPRFKREDIKVEVTKGILKVTAKNSRSSYVREFSLPYVDYDHTSVKLEDGVLKIAIPKNSQGQTKFLDIE